VTGEVEEEEEEEEETRRNKTSSRHQNLKASSSSSRGGPQFVKGNKNLATKYLHNCAACHSSRHGNSGQEEEEEEEEEDREDKTRPEKGPGITRARQASGQEAAGTRETEERGGGKAGRPTTCNTLCGSATDWWYWTVPKWTRAKWTHSKMQQQQQVTHGLN
jgi:hypothetical protein